jgi:hypothetical protein
MTTVYVQFSDSTETKIVGIFGSPQDPSVYPNQGEIDSSDDRIIVYYGPVSAGFHSEYEFDGTRHLWARGVVATKNALAAKKDYLIAAGYTSNGHTYQIRETPLNDISNFLSVAVAYALGEKSVNGNVWRDINNVDVTLDDTELKTLALNAITYRNAILKSWQVHKDAICALTVASDAAHPDDHTLAQYAATEAAELYDVNANWTENGA